MYRDAEKKQVVAALTLVCEVLRDEQYRPIFRMAQVKDGTRRSVRHKLSGIRYAIETGRQPEGLDVGNIPPTSSGGNT